MFTFGLDLDEYGNLEIKPSGMSLGDFTQKAPRPNKGGRAFDGMTYGGVVVAKQMKAAESDDDGDDDTGLVPDREPSRGAPIYGSPRGSSPPPIFDNSPPRKP